MSSPTSNNAIRTVGSANNINLHGNTITSFTANMNNNNNVNNNNVNNNAISSNNIVITNNSSAFKNGGDT